MNAKTMLQCEEELQPLDEILPSNPEDRSKWLLEARTKPAHFDVEWDKYEDSKLLQGIYQYGMGSWEQIKMDPSLGIGDKILANEDKKPQAKHLQSRAEYLLKVLKKQLEQKKGITKPKRQRKAREVLTKEIIENDDLSSNEDAVGKKKHKHHEEVLESSHMVKAAVEKKKKAKREKKVAGPMHFTANNEPRALDVLGDLDPSVFNECKEKMRPVKKALKALDNPDQSLSEAEQVTHTRLCLLQIGEQINKCLAQYNDQEKVKEWRRFVGSFVSIFCNAWFFFAVICGILYLSLLNSTPKNCTNCIKKHVRNLRKRTKRATTKLIVRKKTKKKQKKGKPTNANTTKTTTTQKNIIQKSMITSENTNHPY